MPIECYSGWLIDGTFGGPGAQGVTGKNQRSLLGGSQYSNIFPTFMGTWLGTGSVRWVYGHAYGNTTYLLETYGLDKGLGDAGVRRLITEFRARLALLDMKKWSSEIKNLIDANFGDNTYWEQDYWDNRNYSYTWKMTPYQSVTANGDYLVPNQEITPGWSGANYIPLKVQNGAKQVKVGFYPNGSNSNNTNMNFLLCYRATDGTPVYSEPITGEGVATLRLDKTPSSTNGSQMVFAVVVNTDYKYSGNEDIRTKHFDYKLKIDEGISGAGDANVKYYNDFKLDYKWPEIGANYSSSSQAKESSSSVVVSEAGSFNIAVTLPIDDNYATVSAKFDLNEVATKLGLTATTLSKATFFAQEPDGTINTKTTADGNGHWFDKDGSTVEWGEKYSFTQGLLYNGKSVLFKFAVTLTNEKGSNASDSSTAVMYGLKGPAKHMNLSYRQGKLNVQYNLPKNDNVKISLFSGFGALIAQEITGLQGAGTHTYSFDLNRMPRGVYVVKVSTGAYREARPITIMR